MTLRRGLSRSGFIGGIGALGVPLGRSIPVRAAEAYTMRMSVGEAATSVLGRAAIRFASSVARRSNGQMKIEIYPSHQIASTPEIGPGLISGSLDLAIQGSGFLVPIVPHYALLDLPFIVRDLSTGYRVLDGQVGKDLFAEIVPKGIVGLGWGVAGFREFALRDKPVVAPEDMKGLRMRVDGSAVEVATYRALGALPVAVESAEAFVAFSTHTIDAASNNIDLAATAKWYTVIKYVAMSNHVFSVVPLTASRRKLEALPSPLQTILREEGQAVVPYWRSLIAGNMADATEVLKKNGVTFTDTQYPAFRKAVDPVYATFRGPLGELIDRVARITGAG